MAKEKRLIDAYALLEKQYNSSPLKALQFAEMVVDVRDIEDAPTVDAVEVVRCKDCKHWNKRYETKGLCMNHGNAVLCFTKPDFYCACGERREGE